MKALVFILEYLFYRACMLYENFYRDSTSIGGGILAMSLSFYVYHILWFTFRVPFDSVSIVILCIGFIGMIIGAKNKDRYLELKQNYRSESKKNQKDLITFILLIVAPILLVYLH